MDCVFSASYSIAGGGVHLWRVALVYSQQQCLFLILFLCAEHFIETSVIFQPNLILLIVVILVCVLKYLGVIFINETVQESLGMSTEMLHRAVRRLLLFPSCSLMW